MTDLLEHNIFDWRGPDFLVFYIIALVIAAVWSAIRRKSVMNRFSVRGAEQSELKDPYEIAYLAGGAPRCAQVAVVRLLDLKLVELKRSFFGGDRLIRTIQQAPVLHDVERNLYAPIVANDRSGLKIEECVAKITPHLHGIESRLATLGLRPTASELSGVGMKACLPLFVLFGAGIVKLMVGISREKPVMFLVVLLVVTVVLIIALAARKRRLTPAGEELLLNLQNEQAGTSGSAGLTMGVALLGPAGLVGMEAALGIDGKFTKTIGQWGQQNSGGGCSAGCGASGCGSSGCGGGGGGCGGCGGD